MDANVDDAMIPASLLAAVLSLSPPLLAFEPPSSAEAPPPELEGDEAGYAQALATVRGAMDRANEDPALGATQLRDALNLLRQHAARLATDLAGQELRIKAQLTLARALLAANDADGAREAMDEAIRTARGDPLPTKSFGPGLAALHREREGVLAKQGTGGIAIECHSQCRVFINERPAELATSGLVPGKYRVTIEARDGSMPPTVQTVEVESDGQVALEFGKPAPDPDTDTPTTPGLKPRVLPRWADIVIMSAGVAAIGAGAALLALDGRCPNGSFADTCPQVYVTKTAGIITVAAGSAVFLTGTVLLSVDEVRTANNKRAPQVSLMWTMRF